MSDPACVSSSGISWPFLELSWDYSYSDTKGIDSILISGGAKGKVDLL